MVPEGLNSKLVRVVGKISGTATTIDGTTHQVNEPFSTTAVLTSDTSSNAITAQQATTCNILSLTLGPIYLNLLGLVVTTNQIVIHIFAIQGGGLLGDLLCSLANALATGTPLGSLLGQLNQLLSSILATLML
jgi:transketolase C-terminal domain/subunit